jgi:K+-sensing histidine kinase KdpD
MSSFGISCFVWLIIGCVLGFCAAILYLLVLASSPEEEEKPRKARLPMYFALVRAGLALVGILAIAGFCYALNLDKTEAILILVAAVLLIARLTGPLYGLAASVLALGIISFLFLPPVGSLRVSRSEDQLALLLFVLTTAVGSRLVGGGKRLSG